MKMNWETWINWQFKENYVWLLFYYFSILDCSAMMAKWSWTREVKWNFFSSRLAMLHEIFFSSWYLVERITRNIIYFTSFNIKLSHFLTPRKPWKRSRNLLKAGKWTVELNLLKILFQIWMNILESLYWTEICWKLASVKYY